MSRRSRDRVLALAGGFALLVLLPGCWEQWSETWFPQMKWQKAVQAYERVDFNGRDEGFVPPEGSVPVEPLDPSYERFDPRADTLVNPTNAADLNSLARGRELYQIYCDTCHGPAGMGDGAVSMANKRPGPFAGVFPLVTALGRSDGYVYNIIRNGGGRMPSYKRIPREDRWHLVNYVRYLQKGGRP